MRRSLLRDSGSSFGGAWEIKATAEGLSLCAEGMTYTEDFSRLRTRIKPALLQKELLVRAVRIKAKKQLRIIDATAGLGEDAFLLAAAGHKLLLFEQNPHIAALLADGLMRARKNPQLVDIALRMELKLQDSIEALLHLESAPDVIYLDPMFDKRCKSAAVKKKFQLLHLLEKPCSNADELMHAALFAQPQKIVVKRALKAEPLADIKPSYSLFGKAIRFDVIEPCHIKTCNKAL